MQHSSLAGRRVLVTAGPTWVKLDAVRHISNFSSGRTGMTIARAAADAGAAVTVLLGPGRIAPSDEDRARLRILPYVTFDDLHAAVRQHLSSRAYDALVHTAAVADFRPVEEVGGKLSSGLEELVIRLRPTPKIVDEVKRLDPAVLLVKFKLEAGRTEAELLEIGSRSRARSDADLLVANDMAAFGPDRHPAYLLDASGMRARTATTAELAERLVTEMAALLDGRPLRQGEPPGGDFPYVVLTRSSPNRLNRRDAEGAEKQGE